MELPYIVSTLYNSTELNTELNSFIQSYIVSTLYNSTELKTELKSFIQSYNSAMYLADDRTGM